MCTPKSSSHLHLHRWRHPTAQDTPHLGTRTSTLPTKESGTPLDPIIHLRQISASHAHRTPIVPLIPPSWPLTAQRYKHNYSLTTTLSASSARQMDLITTITTTTTQIHSPSLITLLLTLLSHPRPLRAFAILPPHRTDHFFFLLGLPRIYTSLFSSAARLYALTRSRSPSRRG